MEIEIRLILEKLENIRVSLRKLGPKRRQEKIGLDKINSAKLLYNTYKEILKSLDSSQLSGELTCYILDILDVRIKKSFDSILRYSVKNTEIVTLSKMEEKFDLKAAGSLIPVFDGKEETVERALEGIEMLDSILKDGNNKKLLISFVLKTRLNKISKLKLKSDYDNVSDLISDIKKFLITKKSANSLLLQLNNVSQNEMSIDEYGDKIEKLFTSLTIAQAGDSPKASEILRPLNESLAIKKFADGLRNRRLSTIIAARNYTELNVAIQAAKDEATEQPSTSSMVLNMKGKFRGRRPQYSTRGYWQPQGHRNPHDWNNARQVYRPRGREYGYGEWQNTRQNYPVRNNINNTNFNKYRGQQSRYRGRSQRGRSGNYSYSRRDNNTRNYQMYPCSNDNNQLSQSGDIEPQTCNTTEFFRA